MGRSVNKIRNAGFLEGKADPRGWVWTASRRRVRWHRGLPDHAGDGSGVTIVSHRVEGTAYWSQVVVCKPGKFYRVEATVTCDLVGDESASTDDAAGFVHAVQPMSDERPAGERRVTPALRRASEPVAVRTYYQAPDGIRRIRTSVGITAAAGTASIHHVRFIEILEPEAESHIMAIPAPPHALPAPRVAGSVCVCSVTATERPITRLLSGYLSGSKVRTVSPTKLQARKLTTDALLLPDATPPPSLGSLARLVKLAAERIVVVSLPAFAKIIGGTLSLRRVEQEDDPIHAKVTFANHATRGFALEDVFPYAWSGRAVGSFVQNHFRKTGALKEFCAKHGFVTLLASVCDQDVTSYRPICLYKQTPGGGLFVLDIEPVEAESSTFGEPALAMNLLLGILGQSQNSLGQYVSPVRKEAEFRDSIREMAVRFGPWMVHDADVPIEEVTEQLVTVGREDLTYGLPLKPKPVILVRSGLTSGDVESAYGAFLWFKQFVRMEPHVCPYVQQLASRFRLAWVPLVADWEGRDGWRRGGRAPVRAMTIAAEGTEVAAVIDIASCTTNEVGVVLPSHEGVYQRYAAWLPQLAAAFEPGRYFMPGVGDRANFDDRDGFVWRYGRHDVQMVVDPEAFHTDVHRDVIAAGGQVVRIEIPGSDADFTAHSIQRTDLAATLLEQVIGLQYGLIAVNRRPAPVHFDGFPPVGPGQALIIDRNDPMLLADASQVG